jgi:chlorite dismutase
MCSVVFSEFESWQVLRKENHAENDLRHSIYNLKPENMLSLTAFRTDNSEIFQEISEAQTFNMRHECYLHRSVVNVTDYQKRVSYIGINYTITHSKLNSKVHLLFCW